MDYRLPSYLAYPMPLQYDDERIEQRDFEYMKSMYPETAKKFYLMWKMSVTGWHMKAALSMMNIRISRDADDVQKDLR